MTKLQEDFWWRWNLSTESFFSMQKKKKKVGLKRFWFQAHALLSQLEIFKKQYLKDRGFMPNTHTHMYKYRACLSSPCCVKNSPSTESPEVPEEPEPAELGFQYHKPVTPTWPQWQCIPAELIVKSQMVSLVHRLTQPQQHFINAASSRGGQLQSAQTVLGPVSSHWREKTLLQFKCKQIKSFKLSLSFFVAERGIYFFILINKCTRQNQTDFHPFRHFYVCSLANVHKCTKIKVTEDFSPQTSDFHLYFFCFICCLSLT